MGWKIGGSGKGFPVPSEGEHPAQLVAITDLGVVENSYGERDSLRFVWMTDESDDRDEPLLAFQTLGKSTHEKSNLTKAVKGMGLSAPDEGFDVRTLLGTHARLVIGHNARDGRTYANVTAVLKPAKGQRKVEVPDAWTVPRFKKGTTVSVLDELDLDEPAEAKKEKYVATDEDIAF